MNNNVYHVIKDLGQKTGVLENYIYCEGRKKTFRENRETSSWKEFNLNQVDINTYLESPDCKLSFDPGILAEI